jgi:hypothetical protein
VVHEGYISSSLDGNAVILHFTGKHTQTVDSPGIPPKEEEHARIEIPGGLFGKNNRPGELADIREQIGEFSFKEIPVGT